MGDRFFQEQIVYNPATGATVYSLDANDDGIFESSINLVGGALNDDILKLDLSFYGWYTGHYAQVDWVTIEQVPEPATLALLGLGGIFAARKKR